MSHLVTIIYIVLFVQYILCSLCSFLVLFLFFFFFKLNSIILSATFFKGCGCPIFFLCVCNFPVSSYLEQRFCFIFVVTFTVYKLKQLVQIHFNGYKHTVGNITVQGRKQGSFPYGPVLQGAEHLPLSSCCCGGSRAAFPLPPSFAFPYRGPWTCQESHLPYLGCETLLCTRSRKQNLTDMSCWMAEESRKQICGFRERQKV